MNDIRIDIKVRNNRLVTLIEEQYDNVSQFCKAYNFSQRVVGDYCNLKESPLKSLKTQEVAGWKSSALKIADVLGVLPDEIWPEHMQELKLTVNKGFTTVSSDMVNTLLGSDRRADPLLMYEEEQCVDLLTRAVEQLTAREQKVLAMRFGLNGEEPSTLSQIGDVFGIGPQRVLQIEAKALRKLRHPKRSEVLEDFVLEAGQ